MTVGVKPNQIQKPTTGIYLALHQTLNAKMEEKINIRDLTKILVHNESHSESNKLTM